ncbi:MAG TPA: response regulator [Polyangiaceae bacterium]
MTNEVPAGAEGAENEKVRTILIVDDSDTVRNQVGRALKEAGFAVVGASDGIEGLREALHGEFALILLDVSMPRMGGMELLDRLRQEPKTKDVPVLMLTTEMQELMIRRAKRAGAAGWIIKPVKMQLLVEAIKKVARPLP